MNISLMLTRVILLLALAMSAVTSAFKLNDTPIHHQITQLQTIVEGSNVDFHSTLPGGAFEASISLNSINNLLQMAMPLATYYTTTDHTFFSNRFPIGFKSGNWFLSIDLEAIQIDGLQGPSQKKIGYVDGSKQIEVDFSDADVSVSLYGSFTLFNWFKLSIDNTIL
jgi:hypothetical protein